MTEPVTHSGSCHCGRVRYEADLDLSRVMACNCSICRKRGLLLAFVPPTSFRLGSGSDALTDYQFNRNVIHHLFCSNCGTASFARGVGQDGSEMIAINVRCLDDVDPDGLNIVPFDGKSL